MEGPHFHGAAGMFEDSSWKVVKASRTIIPSCEMSVLVFRRCGVSRQAILVSAQHESIQKRICDSDWDVSGSMPQMSELRIQMPLCDALWRR